MEIWKTIEGYNDYEISSFGRVKSLSRIIVRKKYSFLCKEKILKPGTDNNGYLKINLYNKNDKKTITIHQLVAIHFLNHNPCGYELVVNHINFIRTDNRVDNLEIVTSRENTNQKHLKSTSKYTGVCWSEKDNKWICSIYIKGKTKKLGRFDNEIEASKYYENAIKNIELGLKVEAKKTNFSSKYKGIYFAKNINKWFFYINIDGKQKTSNYFLTETEAYNEYKKNKL